MEIVLHAGVHHTDDERIIKCLQRNAADFDKLGIGVPKPFKYRQLMREVFLAMDKAPAAPDARDILLASLEETGQHERVLMSIPNLFATPGQALRNGKLYPWAGHRGTHISNLFAGDDVEIFVALCNPATFVPAILADLEEAEVTRILSTTDPLQLSWADVIARLREGVPHANITVWCNEDTPMIWAQLIREIAGLDHNSKIKGGFDLLTEIMSKEGMKRFRSYLKEHPNMNEIQKRRVIAAFLDKFGMEEELEAELDLPGWDETLVDDLTEIYDEDLFQIERMSGVEVITP